MNSLSRDLLNKDVRRNKKYEDVVNLLVNGSLGADNNVTAEKKIFTYIKDLMIFAAMVGKKHERTEAVEKENVGISLQTYAGSGSKNAPSDQHYIIFMFGLLNYKDMNLLRDENVDQSIRIFEEYANGGLGLIKEWLIEYSWESVRLLDKILEESSTLNETKGIQVEENPFSYI